MRSNMHKSLFEVAVSPVTEMVMFTIACLRASSGIVFSSPSRIISRIASRPIRWLNEPSSTQSIRHDSNSRSSRCWAKRAISWRISSSSVTAVSSSSLDVLVLGDGRSGVGDLDQEIGELGGPGEEGRVATGDEDRLDAEQVAAGLLVVVELPDVLGADDRVDGQVRPGRVRPDLANRLRALGAQHRHGPLGERGFDIWVE